MKIEKLGRQTMGQNTGKSFFFFFLYDFNDFSKSWGWRRELLCFITKLCKYVWKIET